ncbi:MAG TPA: glycosyltransferase family 39 protein [Stellaceae bacterium]|nr:glycosyltransferase family 39 protein [Stellaceae bacterium]
MTLPEGPEPKREKTLRPLPPGSGDRLDFVASGWRPWFLLILLCLTFYLPGMTTLPPVDRDEARYIQATRQMLESHDYLNIRFQDTARNQKPAAIYWLQSVAVSLVSSPEATSVWPYRSVSVLGAIVAVLGLFAAGSRLFDRRTGLVAAAFLASALVMVMEAHFATTDAVLLALVVLAQGLLARAYIGHRRGESFGFGAATGFWVLQGASILVKGPMLPALSALTVIVLVILDRRAAWLKSLRVLWGLLIVAAIVLPWLYLMQKATNGAFLHASIGTDFLGKIDSGQQSHGAPPGYYLLGSQVTLWPATLFEGLAILWAWRNRRLPATRLALAWLLPFWIVLECVRTKLPHYILPVYPAAALLTARALLAYAEEGFHPRSRAWIVVPAVIWSVVGLAIAGAALFLAVHFDWNAGSCLGASLALAGLLATVWQFWRQHRAQHHIGSALLAVAGAALLVVPCFGMVLPSIAPIWVSREAKALVDVTRKPGEKVGLVGYDEPSLVFLLGTDTPALEPDPAARDLGSGKVAMVLVEQRRAQEFLQAATTSHVSLHPLGSVSGFDYSNGHQTTLTLYRTDIKP